uniref:Uncharacterized protein n=1 Tax=Anopheles atroparvus TaxID=41427 RepID=A0A182J1Q1_ANOAO
MDEPVALPGAEGGTLESTDQRFFTAALSTFSELATIDGALSLVGVVVADGGASGGGNVATVPLGHLHGPTAASMSIQAELSSGRFPAVSLAVSTTEGAPASRRDTTFVEELMPPSCAASPLLAACENVSSSSAGLSPYCPAVSFVSRSDTTFVEELMPPSCAASPLLAACENVSSSSAGLSPYCPAVSFELLVGTIIIVVVEEETPPPAPSIVPSSERLPPPVPEFDVEMLRRLPPPDDGDDPWYIPPSPPLRCSFSSCLRCCDCSIFANAFTIASILRSSRVSLRLGFSVVCFFSLRLPPVEPSMQLQNRSATGHVGTRRYSDAVTHRDWRWHWPGRGQEQRNGRTRTLERRCRRRRRFVALNLLYVLEDLLLVELLLLLNQLHARTVLEQCRIERCRTGTRSHARGSSSGRCHREKGGGRFRVIMMGRRSAGLFHWRQSQLGMHWKARMVRGERQWLWYARIQLHRTTACPLAD